MRLTFSAALFLECNRADISDFKSQEKMRTNFAMPIQKVVRCATHCRIGEIWIASMDCSDLNEKFQNRTAKNWI